MLARPIIIKKALTNFSVRNNLINQQGEKNLYRLVLDFWLGANFNLEKILKEKEFADSLPFIYIGYYCILILDKYMSALDSTSASFAQLNQCAQDILLFYNKNYLLLKANPQQLYLDFEFIVSRIDIGSGISPLVRQAKGLCLQEINRVFKKHLFEAGDPLPQTMDPVFKSLRDLVNRDFFSTLGTYITTSIYPLHNFYKNPIDFQNHIPKKLFLKTKNGAILDGLLINTYPSNRIVLALVGHFQTEHSYLKASYINFYNLFSSDILFINHRNYSPRSFRVAKSIHELAYDVVEFAKHFHYQGKEIVLYGMCGGSAHMVLAATILNSQHIPFKLIIDRFADKYSHIFDLKSLQRRDVKQVKKEISPLFQTPMKILFWPALLSFIGAAKLFFRCSKTNINFADKIRLIPENDVLVLQAKSKKIKDKPEPEFTDIFIHPKNDLRFALKAQRHNNKVILKKLMNNCRAIAENYNESKIFQDIFLKLAECFSDYLKLIDNEKLMSDEKPTQEVTDLHPCKLYQLTTRHRMPIQQFLHGFFSKPLRSCDTVLAALVPYSANEILTGLNNLHPHFGHDFSQTSLVLSDFLMDIKQHENFVCHVGNRLFESNLTNMRMVLQELLNTPLFRMLANNPREPKAICFIKHAI